MIEVGDIVLYDDPSTAVIFIKAGLNIQRKQLGLPADTRLYGHSGIIIEKEGKLYQAQTSFSKGLILTPWVEPTGVRAERTRILTPKVPLSDAEKASLSNYSISIQQQGIKYDKAALLHQAIYLVSKQDIWLGRTRRHTNKLYCFEATAVIMNHVRPYFDEPWKVTSLDMIYSDYFITKK